MTIEYLLKRAKELISTGKIKGATSELLKQAIEQNPAELEGFLMDIADQAQDEYSSKVTKRIYGNELVGIALAYKISRKEAEEEDNPKPKKRKGTSVNEANTKVKGGLADKLTTKDIAEKFGVSVTKIERELRMGIPVELEHTKDKSVAKDIAMDHLAEMPDYYTRLNKLEDTAIKFWDKKKIKESLRENLNSFLYL
jgi:hypothetical protein